MASQVIPTFYDNAAAGQCAASGHGAALVHEEELRHLICNTARARVGIPIVPFLL